jgi:hypothetical protein
MFSRKAVIGASIAVALTVPALLLSADDSSHPPVVDSTLTKPLQPLLTPVTQVLAGLTSLLTQSRDLKLLVLSADGTDPSFGAIRAILDQMGVPYDAVILTQTGGALPPLSDAGGGNYQGIILSTGNLVTCQSGPCVIALPAAGWTALDKYAAQYGVRTLAYYTFPDPRYGIAWTGNAMQGGMAAFQPASSTVFPDLKRTTPMEITNSYIYGATPVAGPGETSTPVLTVNGEAVAVLHKKADKREYLALTFDNNPYLLHTLSFGYGLVNWVTKGIFIGARKMYYSPQIDDIFLGSDLYDGNNANCRPSGFQLDPTVDPTLNCPAIRMTGNDLKQIDTWQDSATTSGSNIKVTMAFNGFGTTAAGQAPIPDALAAEATRQRSSFFWVTHTYDHENLDCFLPVANSGICKGATYAQSAAELSQNVTIGNQLGLQMDSQSIVTPNLSGLANPNFLSAAANAGIKYMVMDSSKLPPAGIPHNTAIKSTIQSSILMIPRRPTNIFYNVYTPTPGVGSAVGEYNYFYGPMGISRVGGPGGPPFFYTDQTYTDIINREADFIVKNMLRGEVYPLMFHQANLVAYDGTHSLFTDLSAAALAKLRSITGLPVNSLSNTSIAQVTLDRMSFNQSGVSASLNPGLSLVIKVSKAAKIPVTGVCSLGCDSNGGAPITTFSAIPLLPTIVLLP